MASGCRRFRGQEQEVFELAAKEFGPRRVIESQRGEASRTLKLPVFCPYEVSTPMMATMISGGTP
jgi:hypothetical protein